MSGLEAALAAGRFAQYAGVSLVGGGGLFQLYGVRTAGATTLARAGVLLALAGVLAWLMAETGTIGGAADAFAPAQVWSVAADTGFGRAALIRAALLIAAGLVLIRPAWPLAAGLGLAAAASLAWSGHGVMGDGAAGALHLAADAVHALAAAVWIGALIMLALLISGRDAAPVKQGLGAFSGIGLGVVAAILLTGLINGGFLVGLAGLPHLLHSLYGRLLAAKLALFTGMLALAGVNRWRKASAASVGTETALGLVVLALVAWMGAVPPPMEMTG